MWRIWIKLNGASDWNFGCSFQQRQNWHNGYIKRITNEPTKKRKGNEKQKLNKNYTDMHYLIKVLINRALIDIIHHSICFKLNLLGETI